MALFGKKNPVEPTAPQPNAEDEIRVAGGDADELQAQDGAQVVDLDAIADELDEPTSGGTLDLSKPAPQANDPFASDAHFEAGTVGAADNAFDLDATFHDGSLGPVTAPQTDENPFGAPADVVPGDSIDIEPVNDVHAPPMTHTAPFLTSDAMAMSGAPAVRRSLPLPMLLAALGLLAGLGAVGYLVTSGSRAPEEPVVAVNPGLAATKTPGADGANAVDGVPIAPGPILLSAPVGGRPVPTVPLTPALLNQLKALWKQGAAAKKRGDYAGARAAWTKMLQLRPNHPGVQSAIDQLPAA